MLHKKRLTPCSHIEVVRFWSSKFSFYISKENKNLSWFLNIFLKTKSEFYDLVNNTTDFSTFLWSTKVRHGGQTDRSILITFLRYDRDIDVVLFTNDIDMILYHISGEYLYWQRWPAQSHFIFTFGVCLFLSLLWHCLLRQDGYNNIVNNDFKQSKSRFWHHLWKKGRARKDQKI